MKPLDQCKTAEQVIAEAKKADRKHALSYICLWECNRLRLLPIAGDSCFGTLLEMYLNE